MLAHRLAISRRPTHNGNTLVLISSTVPQKYGSDLLATCSRRACGLPPLSDPLLMRESDAGQVEGPTVVPPQRRSARQRWARPFLVPTVWAALSMTLWVSMLSGRLELPTAFDSVSWHAHEAQFGYLGTVVAGLLLTAVQNWVGRSPVVGWTLFGLFTLWLVGRGAVAVSSYLPPLIVAAIDLSCLIVLGGVMPLQFIIGRNWHNLIVLAMLGVLAACCRNGCGRSTPCPPSCGVPLSQVSWFSTGLS